MRAQPNPPGKDTIWRGQASNERFNEEWIEFEAVAGDRNIVGDEVYHLTFADTCTITGEANIVRFNQGQLSQGQRLQLHTGTGLGVWVGNVFHMYLGLGWFIWNNKCGDRATIRYNGGLIDTAGYAPGPPEGILVRVPGTDRLEPAARRASSW